VDALDARLVPIGEEDIPRVQQPRQRTVQPWTQSAKRAPGE
jgi:hypothetical protein